MRKDAAARCFIVTHVVAVRRVADARLRAICLLPRLRCPDAMLIRRHTRRALLCRLF